MSFVMELNNHIFQYYRKGGLKEFCLKYGISYNSARKIYNGSNDYPGIKEKMEKAIKKDKKGRWEIK